MLLVILVVWLVLCALFAIGYSLLATWMKRR
jgi:hypothetical protein